MIKVHHKSLYLCCSSCLWNSVSAFNPFIRYHFCLYPYAIAGEARFFLPSDTLALDEDESVAPLNLQVAFRVGYRMP